MSGQVQVQPDPISTLPADRVFRLERTKLFQIAGRPRPVTPKRGCAKLSLEQAPNARRVKAVSTPRPAAPPAGRGKGQPTTAAATDRVSTGVRMTALTREVLTAVATLSERDGNPSNREVADLAGVKDDGQISKLLHRLKGHGLLQNSGGTAGGVPNAWRLTSDGEQLLQATRPTRGPHREAAR